jgi:hypothetical protein
VEHFAFLEKITAIKVKAEATSLNDVKASVADGGIDKNYFALRITSNLKTGNCILTK